MVDSTSSNSSQSTSTPVTVQSPQTQWGLQLSQMLAMLGQSQYDWAKQQYNTGMGVTEQNIANYMEMSGKGAGLAQTLIQQYEQQFAPLVQQYIAQAQSYNSPERQRYEMGRAESTAAQASQAARDESARKLQSFGVRPDSGRYQDLISAGRMQDAASRAGAGNQAYQDTAAAGRQMLEKGVQFGQNVPGMAVNALNSAYTGITGAQSAIQGQQHAGAELTSTAAPLMNASAAANKTPPVGQQSSSGSSGVSNSHGNDPSSGSGRQPTGSGSGGDGGGRSGSGDVSGQGGRATSSPGLGQMNLGRGGGGAGVMQIPGGGETDWTNPDWTGIGQGDMPQGDDQSSGPSYPYGNQEDVNSDTYNQNTDWTNPDFTGIGQGDATDDTTGSIGDSSGYSGEGAVTDTSDQSNFQDTTDYSGDYTDESFAGGGGVLPTEGGAVPKSASPSQGQQTDDVSARLNAGEFVIPRDVVGHKGSEFFDRLIANSRKARTGMAGPPTGATMKPALRMKPSFVSQRM